MLPTVEPGNRFQQTVKLANSCYRTARPRPSEVAGIHEDLTIILAVTEHEEIDIVAIMVESDSFAIFGIRPPRALGCTSRPFACIV